MARSAVLSGRDRALDRAQQRGRLDRARLREDRTPDPDAQLASWLRSHAPTLTEPALLGYDLDEYLRATSEVNHSAAERLRQLAVFVESTLAAAPQPRGWLALERIYLAAIRLDPRDASAWNSRSVSAHACAELLPREPSREPWERSPVRRRMMRVARSCAEEALRLEPHSARLVRHLGDLHYHDPERGPAEALPFYDRALALEASNGWALLYRAHCLQDLARFREAAEAYERVPAAFLVGPRAWRLEHLLEQRAYCWLRAGDEARALREFLALLARWETDPALLAEAWGAHLDEALRGPLRAALIARVQALVERASHLGRQPFGGLSLRVEP